MPKLINGIVKYAAGQPKPGKDRINIVCTIDGEEHKIWGDVGTIIQAFKKGDTAILKPYATRDGDIGYKLAEEEDGATQHPSGQASVPAYSAAQAYSGQASAAPQATQPQAGQARPERWSDEHWKNIHKEMEERAKLLLDCHNIVADLFKDENGDLAVSEEALQKYSTTLYIDLKSAL